MFVGRDRELAALASALESLSSVGGSLFLLAGEPGIGKSRLATEAAEVARARGLTPTWGRCWEAGGAPAFWPWREVCDSLEVRFPEPIATGDPAEARFALFREFTRNLVDEQRVALRRVEHGRCRVVVRARDRLAYERGHLGCREPRQLEHAAHPAEARDRTRGLGSEAGLETPVRPEDEDRHGPQHVERARTAVQRRIKDALDRIAEQDPGLGTRLRRCITTGIYCSYRPDP